MDGVAGSGKQQVGNITKGGQPPFVFLGSQTACPKSGNAHDRHAPHAEPGSSGLWDFLCTPNLRNKSSPSRF